MSNQSLGHLMIDLETMGVGSNSVICSIGAVEFNIETGETGRRFYERISIQSCLDLGLKVSGSTIEWWLTKSEEARAEVAKGGKHLSSVLFEFTDFFKLLDTPDIKVWGNGARFDIGLLEDAFKAYRIPTIPWNFRNERDVRTLVSLAPAIKESTEMVGIAHHPIDDCLYQIKYCYNIWKAIYPLTII